MPRRRTARARSLRCCCCCSAVAFPAPLPRPIWKAPDMKGARRVSRSRLRCPCRPRMPHRKHAAPSTFDLATHRQTGVSSTAAKGRPPSNPAASRASGPARATRLWMRACAASRRARRPPSIAASAAAADLSSVPTLARASTSANVRRPASIRLRHGAMPRHYPVVPSSSSVHSPACFCCWSSVQSSGSKRSLCHSG